jgi:hypothetical protein
VAVRVGTDGDPDVETRDMFGQIGTEKVGVAGVGDVCGEEERAGIGAAHETRTKGSARRGRESFHSAFDGEGEEVGAGALAEKGADLLVVKEGDELDGAVVGIRVGGEEGHEGGPAAEFVVDAAAEDEFPVQTPCLGGLGVEQLEFPVEDLRVVAGDAEFSGDELDELRGLAVDEAAGWAEGLDWSSSFRLGIGIV